MENMLSERGDRRVCSCFFNSHLPSFLLPSAYHLPFPFPCLLPFGFGGRHRSAEVVSVPVATLGDVRTLKAAKANICMRVDSVSGTIDGLINSILTIMPTEPPIESPMTMLHSFINESLPAIIVCTKCSLQDDRLSRSVDGLIPSAFLDLTHGGAVFQLVIPGDKMPWIARVVRPLIHWCEPVA